MCRVLEGRGIYVSEAKGIWLYAVAWPASTEYFLAEHVVLHDLSAEVPPGLAYAAPSPSLHGRASTWDLTCGDGIGLSSTLFTQSDVVDTVDVAAVIEWHRAKGEGQS